MIGGRAAVLACVLASGCVQSDIIATFDAVGFCEGGGPVIEVGDGRCGGDLARRAFRFAACSCEAMVTSAAITTDAFDSGAGSYSPGPGGALGVNGRLDLTAPVSVGGALLLGDPTGVNAGAGARLEVAQNLASDGPVVSEAEIVVRGNLRAGGRVVARDLTVGGTFTVPADATVEVTGTLDAPDPTRAPVAVPAPCDCAAGGLVDIPAEVEARRFDHDDERAGLEPSSLADASGQVDLPCGRYFFDRINAPSDLTIHATGRVAVFVAGDVAVSGRLSVTLAPDAELDLLIAGQLVASAPPEIGVEDRPAAARVYVGGAGTVQLGRGGTFFGNLYAPRAELVASGPVEVFGALFARRIAVSGALTAHFDRAVEGAAAGCLPVDGTCTSCLDCPAGGCVGGFCSPCQSDAHCCAPKVCVGGACVSDWVP